MDTTTDFTHRDHRVVYDARKRLWKVSKGQRFVSWVSGDEKRVKRWIDTHLVFKTPPR